VFSCSLRPLVLSVALVRWPGSLTRSCSFTLARAFSFASFFILGLVHLSGRSTDGSRWIITNPPLNLLSGGLVGFALSDIVRSFVSSSPTTVVGVCAFDLIDALLHCSFTSLFADYGLVDACSIARLFRKGRISDIVRSFVSWPLITGAISAYESSIGRPLKQGAVSAGGDCGSLAGGIRALRCPSYLQVPSRRCGWGDV
jgi:small-conductance mechanosensitive channel